MKGPLYVQDITSGWKKILWTEQKYHVGNFFRDDAGLWMWNEEKSVHGNTSWWDAHGLRLIADKLDELNTPIRKELIEAYEILNTKLEGYYERRSDSSED